MNVLSLFDGISCGQLALQRAKIEVKNYFASEIDEKAIQVTQHHFPNTIQLGSVVNVKGENLPKIDLLIGGSPCQGFSFTGKQLNFNDARSKLFFEYVRLLNEVKPTYFLLENVMMKKRFSDIITQNLKVAPILIDSKHFSKQTRRRLYWTNIPILPFFKNGSDLLFNRYLYILNRGYYKEGIKLFEKHPPLMAQRPATKHRIVVDLDEAMKDLNVRRDRLRRGESLTRGATPEECEELQTLPVGYTKNISKNNRYKVIGNGWTVDVIAHIFRGMKEKNETKTLFDF